MPVLTYGDLGPNAVEMVGKPIGCDAAGWPWRVQSVTSELRYPLEPGKPARRVTLLEVEPWPLPPPGGASDAERDALKLAREVAQAALEGNPLCMVIPA